MITNVGFPQFKPSGKALPFTDELTDEMQKSVKALVSEKGIVNVLEIGSLRGDLTNFLTDHIKGSVVSIGNWGDKSVTWNDRGMETAQTEWETFCINCWASRLRVVPVETDNLLDTFEWVKKNRFDPDLIWIHTPSSSRGLLALLMQAREIFPRPLIAGARRPGHRPDFGWFETNNLVKFHGAEIWYLID